MDSSGKIVNLEYFKSLEKDFLEETKEGREKYLNSISNTIEKHKEESYLNSYKGLSNPMRFYYNEHEALLNKYTTHT